ncbi:Chitin synthase, class 7 [Basidiobolus ranarum]|uniref:Chitin synthase, class 7 n=1 Tax=Basidiobolus ranarum TaxID=34480 RepID=A0ABR2VR19_9FUNG
MGQFGQFTDLCHQFALPICPLVGPQPGGLEPSCIARNIDIGGTLFLEPGLLIMDLIAMVMTVIMVYNVFLKYTAVGRKEMLIFFYLYFLTLVFDFITMSGLIPASNGAYKYIVAVHISLISTTIWALLVNGFIGFQFAEDGSRLSLWSLRISSLVVFGLVYATTIGTTLSWTTGFSPDKPYVLWVIYWIFNPAAVFIYFVLQVILVVGTLQERWPLGDVILALISFVGANVISHFFSKTICNSTNHYIDGPFFGVIFNLLAVMMVYKYWDSITKEDLEYTFGDNAYNWEVRELLNADDESDAQFEFDADGVSSIGGSSIGGQTPLRSASRDKYFQ